MTWSSPRLHSGAFSSSDYGKQKKKFYNCTDNTQIHITISPRDYGPTQTLGKCIEQINYWMCQKCLQLNKDKTEVAVVRGKEERLKVSAQL